MIKKRALFFISSMLLVSVTFITLKPIIFKFIMGSARVIGTQTKCDIYIDGEKEEDAKLFMSKSNFEGNEKRDYLILYLRNVENYNEFPVLVIDKENKLVKFPNASKSDYDLLLENLLQSDSGANVMVALNNQLQGPGFEPDLKINEEVVEFNILVKNKTHKIRIKNF